LISTRMMVPIVEG